MSKNKRLGLCRGHLLYKTRMSESLIFLQIWSDFDGVFARSHTEYETECIKLTVGAISSWTVINFTLYYQCNHPSIIVRQHDQGASMLIWSPKGNAPIWNVGSSWVNAIALTTFLEFIWNSKAKDSSMWCACLHTPLHTFQSVNPRHGQSPTPLAAGE